MNRFLPIFLFALTTLISQNLVLKASIVHASENAQAHISIKVPQMVCGRCETAIRQKLEQLNGISQVSASAKNKRVEVTFDPDLVSQDKIKQSIEELGFKTIL